LVWACVFLAHGFLERWLVDTSHRRAIDEHLQSEVDNFQGQLDRQIARMIDAANQVAGEPRTAEILVDSNQHQESDWQKLARTLNPGNPLHELLSRAKARL